MHAASSKPISELATTKILSSTHFNPSSKVLSLSNHERSGLVESQVGVVKQQLPNQSHRTHNEACMKLHAVYREAHLSGW